MNDTYCDEIKDLYDESSNYIKTVCLIPAYKDFDSGTDRKCLSSGMSLYNVDAPEAKKALLDFTSFLFSRLGTIISIDGKTSEGCAVVHNREGSFDVSYLSCSMILSVPYYYCQYMRTPKTNELGNH